MLLFLQAQLGEPSSANPARRTQLGEPSSANPASIASGWGVERLSINPEAETWALSLRSPEGSACTVRLSRAELAVTSDFAHTLGHPDAERLSKIPLDVPSA